MAESTDRGLRVIPEMHDPDAAATMRFIIEPCSAR